MYGAELVIEESGRTAFLKAEKKYKIYYDNAKKFILESFRGSADLPDGFFRLKCDFDLPVFGLVNRPGFYFIPGTISVEEQCHWMRKSLTTFSQSPNGTNHNAIYGPLQNLFLAAKEGKVLIEENRLPENIHSKASLGQNDVSFPQWKFVKELDSFIRDAWKPVSASFLLRKLQWNTFDLQFAWSKSSYNLSLPHKKIPDRLWAKKTATPAMPCVEEFNPEAAIVNCFGLGDMLGRHLDDMEKDWSKPIVSIRCTKDLY